MNKINTMNGNDNKTMKKLELAMRTETTGNCPALGERSALVWNLPCGTWITKRAKNHEKIWERKARRNQKKATAKKEANCCEKRHITHGNTNKES
jgi:hypothetical protein